MLLVVADRFDPTVDEVADRLNAWGVPWFRFNVAEYPERIRIDWSLDGFRIRSAAHKCRSEEVRSAWYRKPKSVRVSKELEDVHREFAENEANQVVEGIYRLLDVPWFNNPLAIRQANNKLLQLRDANSLGLNVPRTIVTTDPEKARKFVAQQASVAKSIYSPLVGNQVVFTQSIDSDEDFSSVKYAPVLFQEKIEKVYDLRITVLGDELVACRIASKELDWRVLDDPPLELIELSQEFRENCSAFGDLYGLRLYVIDGAVDKEGKEWFLELNPNGQWGFINVVYPVFDKVARMLAEAC